MTYDAHVPSPETLLEHREWLRAIARSLVADESSVDDAEQRTWLAVLENRRPVASVRGWLRRVVRNSVADERRSDSRRRARERHAMRPEGLPPTDHLAIRMEAQRVVAAAVMGLPEPYRATVLLRYVEDLPVDEVASRMRVPAKTVYTRLRRAHDLLRAALDREFGDRRAWLLVLLPFGEPRSLVPIAAATGGGLLMATKMKLAAAAAAVLLLAAGAWWTMDAATAPGGGVEWKDAAAVAPVAPREKDAPHARARLAEPQPAPVAPPPVAQGPTIAGRVVDAGGHPVAVARVVSHPDDLSKPVDAAKAGTAGSRSFVATSGADGRFEVRADPQTVQAVLTAAGDDGLGQASAAPRDRDVEIKLIAWKSLSGKVTNTAKEPVAGARVTMHLLLDALVEDRVATSDTNGEYHLERIPSLGWTPDAPSVGRGRHGWVIAEADGYAPLYVERDGMGGGRRGADPSKLDLVLVRGIAVAGKVVDGDTKSPLPGATVVCWSDEGMMGFGGPSGASMSNPWGRRPLGETTSAEDGSFRFEHVPAQGPNGIASHNSGKHGQTLGHVAAWREGYVFGGDQVPVSKDETTFETTIALWPSATIAGRVVDTDGKPVGGAWVYVGVDERRPELNGFPDFYPESAAANAKADADGRYSLRTFRASRAGPTTGKLVAGVYGPNGGSSKPVDVTANAGETITAPDLVIDTGAIPRATIIVTNDQGAPVAGATMQRSYTTFRTGLDGRASWSLGFQPKADAPIAAVTAVVRARGFAPRQVDFTPTRGAPVEVPVALRPGAQIAGRVQMADGRPGARASVLVADGTKSPNEAFGDGFRPMSTDSSGNERLVVYATVTAKDDGTFEATDLPDGPYLVAAQMGSRAPAGFNRPQKMLRDSRGGVAAGTSDLVFTIPPDDAPPTQALEVVVADASGGVVENCGVQATFGGARFYAQRRDPSRLRFDALPAGKGTIEVSAPGWATTTLRDVTITADSPPAPIAVQLDRGITLRGTVRADSGTLPDETSVVVLPVEQSDLGGAAAGSVRRDGTFELTGFLPGRYRASFADTRRQDGSVTFVAAGDGIVTVPEGRREVVVDLLLVRAGSISMSALDKRLPAPFGGGASDPEKEKFGAASRIEIVDAAGAVVAAQCPVYANLALSVNVAPGDYVVRLTLPGETPQEQRVTVKAGVSALARFAQR
jgi:RNA polymerase sigma-70 factor (ECF subfamily)